MDAPNGESWCRYYWSHDSWLSLQQLLLPPRARTAAGDPSDYRTQCVDNPALSPPWFNFESSYISGDVLEFKLGMSRSELKQILVARYDCPHGVQGGPEFKSRRPDQLLRSFVAANRDVYILSTSARSRVPISAAGRRTL
jgi:hypothetical protein